MKCPACGHKHKEVNENYEVEYENTEPFKEIEGHFRMEKDCGYMTVEVYLFACPRCNNVILGE